MRDPMERERTPRDSELEELARKRDRQEALTDE